MNQLVSIDSYPVVMVSVAVCAWTEDQAQQTRAPQPCALPARPRYRCDSFVIYSSIHVLFTSVLEKFLGINPDLIVNSDDLL